MSDWTLEEIIVGLVAVIGLVVLGIFLAGLMFGAEFYSAGCTGEIEGSRCFSIGASVVCSDDAERFRDNVIFGYDNPRCNIYTDRQSCEITSYPNITRQDNVEIQVCRFVESGRLSGLETESACLMSALFSCADLGPATTPSCRDVPGCVPVNALKEAIARISPR
jgi:hypothetical protein